jgi:hypothetical protein
MKQLLLFFICLSLFAAKAQNGFTTYTTNLSLTGPLLKQTAFIVDNSGNRWFGFRAANISGNVGLVKYDGISWTMFNTSTNPALPLTNMITALAADNVGNIWIGTSFGGILKFDGVSFYSCSGLPANTVNCIESVGNQIYVGTDAGLYRYDGVSFTGYTVANSLLPSDTVVSIKAETSGLLWLGGYNRMMEFVINGSYTTTSYINHPISNAPGMINCVYIDSQNTKWLGTTTQGILKYNGANFQNAASLYDLFGSVIPNKVLDITAGLHNGIVFKNAVNNSANIGSKSGLTELAPNNMIYQYFYSTPTYTLGDYLERDGANILISQGGPNINYAAQKMYFSFNESTYSLPLGPINVNNFKTLDINNVRAGVANRGDMHWDVGGSGNALYEVPKGSGRHSSFATSLWIGGLDNSNLLHGAAQTYRQNGHDFWPGPLDTITATTNTTIASSYDKIWKVSYTDINNFITAFNSGSVVATPDMLTWPAHGTGNNSRNLAPFVDRNNDGTYNPNDGDYPKIKGDQTLYFIYNDNLATHSTSYTPMGVEVQGMAYAYGCSATISGKPELSYTTFYDYKIINRSTNNYHDVYLGMWSDIDIGYYGDNHIGCNVTENYAFGINGDSFDDNFSGTLGYGSYLPAQGIHIVKGPIASVLDGIDNNNNGTIDEVGEDCRLDKFSNYNLPIPTVTPMTDPSLAQHYYNYMKAIWKDGTPFTCGSNGYGGSINTNWVYSGDPNNSGVNTDPSNTCGYWTETSVGNAAGDRRIVLGSGPFTLNAGQMQEIEYAFVTSFDSSAAGNNIISLAKLKTDIQKVNAFYNQINKPNCLQAITIGVSELLKQNDFALFPNPAKSLITISSTIIGSVKVNYEIVDILGKVVIQSENTGSDKFSIDINVLNSGIYFLRLQVNNSLVVKKFVKE